jgi:NAD(P)-dependent dehydrogenase (short-subunit alcohol dehydrogenase family)
LQQGAVAVKIGALYPQIELDGDPRAFDAIVRAVDELGYESFAMFDHVVGAVNEGRESALSGPYTEHDPFQDPLVAFAYCAGITHPAVLNTSSLAGVTANGPSLAYTASTGALSTLGQAMAIASRIRVNIICPRFIDTEWFDKHAVPGGSDRLREHRRNCTALQTLSAGPVE